MFKRAIAAGIIAGAGVMAFSATPALAHGDDPQNTQIIGVQTCRSVDIVGIGAAIHNLLGVTDESGDCINGSQSNR